jgi:glycosyltransferase
MLFSIIIPVYNVEKYLNQCIDSVLAQEFTDYEVILVDDGSTDGSSAICDEYVQKYNQIKVIHKTNGGLSDARNFGIKEAQGDYLIFLDSDDFWNGATILYEINKIIKKENPDLIITGYTLYFSEHNKKLSTDFSLVKELTTDFIKDSYYLVNNNIYEFLACNKIVKRNIIINNNIFFPKGKFSEDMPWNYKLVDYIKRYALYRSNFYYYRQNREGQITRSIKIKNVEDIKSVVDNNLGLLKKEDVLFDFKIRYLLDAYTLTFHRFFELSKKEQFLIKQKIKQFMDFDRIFILEIQKHKFLSFPKWIKYHLYRLLGTYKTVYITRNLNRLLKRL